MEEIGTAIAPPMMLSSAFRWDAPLLQARATRQRERRIVASECEPRIARRKAVSASKYSSRPPDEVSSFMVKRSEINLKLS
jgi:hypothetical protein